MTKKQTALIAKRLEKINRDWRKIFDSYNTLDGAEKAKAEEKMNYLEGKEVGYISMLNILGYTAHESTDGTYTVEKR